MARRIINLYCTSCKTRADKYLESDTRKIKCECGGTLHKIIVPPTFKQNSSHGQVNTAGDKAFQDAGKKAEPIRAYPEEPDIEG